MIRTERLDMTEGLATIERLETSKLSIRASTPEGVVDAVLANLRDGQIDNAMAHFANTFVFRDHGIALKFTDKDRLAEFFQRKRESFPDGVLRIGSAFANGDHVVVTWTFRATVKELFYGQQSWVTPVCLHGVSVVRTEKGEISDWADYYDGLTSRRTALASYFTDWIEL